jgi:hypothetical protein
VCTSFQRLPGRWFHCSAARERAALAQERYYSSYGEPTPLIAPESPPPSNDTPWLPIAFIAAALAIAAAARPNCAGCASAAVAPPKRPSGPRGGPCVGTGLVEAGKRRR